MRIQITTKNPDMPLSHNFLSNTLARTQGKFHHILVCSLLCSLYEIELLHLHTHTHTHTYTQKMIFVSLVESNENYNIFLWALSLMSNSSIHYYR